MRTVLTRPLLAVLVAIALVASACGGEKEPTAELAEAMQALADNAFAYTFTLDLEADAAQTILGPDAGMAAGFVNSLAIKGVKGEGAFSLSAEIMGFEPLAIRSYDGGENLYLRVGLAEILQGFGADASALGLDGLADLPGDAGQLVGELLEGRWVGFVGLDTDDVTEDQEAAAAELGVDLQEFRQLGDDLRQRLSDVQGLLNDLATVTRTEADGVKTFDVAIRTEPALREMMSILDPVMEAFGQATSEADLEADIQEMLQGAPERLPGLQAEVVDGDLTELRFDVGALLAATQDDSEVGPGDVVLRLAFSEHGSAAVPDAPADATTYDQEQLEDLGELLGDPALLTGRSGILPGAADEQASLLLTLQITAYQSDGRYSEDLDALLDLLPDVRRSMRADARYGICTTDDGQAFVVGADVDGTIAYYDQDFQAYGDGDALACTPELRTVEGAGT